MKRDAGCGIRDAGDVRCGKRIAHLPPLHSTLYASRCMPYALLMAPLDTPEVPLRKEAVRIDLEGPSPGPYGKR